MHRDALMSIAQALDWGRRRLVDEGAFSDPDARMDAEYLLASALSCTRTYLHTWPERALTQAQQQTYDGWLARRAQGEPVAYLLGQRGFWTLDLEVSPCTLIPRADTECLVEQALLRFPEGGPGRLLDLGTGTGAIALALASEWPDTQVVASDKNAEAVALAERNRARLKLAHVQILLSDWWQAIDGTFDLIVSNPPYIAGDDRHLGEGDVRFEPRSALVAEDKGLADLCHIIAQAPDYLHRGGWLLLEHGWQQAEAVRAALRARGFVEVSSHTDCGGNPRVSGGRWP